MQGSAGNRRFGFRGRSRVAALAVLLAVSLWSEAHADKRAVPRDRQQITLSYAPLVRRAGPAVVNILAVADRVERRVSPLFDDPFFRRFFGDLLPDRPRRRSRQSLGSGVILDPAGLIVTNHHVIANADRIKVVLADRREFAAEVLLADERTDLAVLEIEPGGGPLPFISMRDSDSLEVGDLVLAIGNPFGVGQTVTSGIVSALARTAIGITDYSFFIQTDAAINPGNSGGALIAMDGRLIGVNTAIFSGKSGGGSVGIGFAVPSNMVRTVLEAARGGRLVRPWLGASGQTVTPELAGQFGLDRPQGVLINEIYPRSPADRAGLAVGDVVLAVGGVAVADHDALRYRIATLPMGRETTLQVRRRGRDLVLRVRPGAPAGEPRANATTISGRNPFSGATVANLSPAFALENGFDEMARGVIVMSTARGSAAYRVGLRAGDIVLSVAGRRIERVADLTSAVRGKRASWRISIRRGDQVLRSEIAG